MFYVTLFSPSSVAGTARGNPIVVNQDLKFIPIKYSATDRGGFDQAEILVTGPDLAVQNILGYLRYGVEIVNEFGSVCWSGYINEIECSFGGMVYTISMNEVANKVTVLYSYKDVSGTQVSGTTSAAESAVSQDRYGTKEIVIPASDIEQTAAEQLRDTELENRQYPLASGEINTSGSVVEAKLLCKGWWHALDWVYYSNENGREENTNDNAVQPLALGFTSTEVGFTTGRTIQDMSGRFLHFPEGSKFILSGSTSNDGTYTVSETAEGEAESLTATTISFEANDDIKDSTARLGFVKKGSLLLVSGSTHNDGYHVADNENEIHITTWTGYGPGAGTITTETAGASITVAQGNYVRTVEGVSTNEIPGDSVTVEAYGSRIAQSFQLSSASGWDASRIGIKVAKTGSPGQNITVRLCADSGSGSPGSVLATGTILETAVTSAMNWQWADLNTNVSLSTSTTYWIEIYPSSGNTDWDDFYTVAVDEDLSYGSGTMLLRANSTWYSRPTNADLAFRVWGEEVTTDQISTMADTSQFIRDIVIENASGISTNQYRNGENTVLDEIQDLLDIGNTSNKRLIGYVSDERVLHVYADPGSSLPPVKWTKKGVLTDRFGNRLEPGKIVFGQWMEIEDVPPNIDSLAPFSPRYITEAEYDVQSEKLIPILGERNNFDFGVKKG